MKPSQLSAYLRHMASQIDLARSPRKDLVVRDLRRALAALTGGRRWANVPGGGGDAMHTTDAVIRVSPDKWVIVPLDSLHTDYDLDGKPRMTADEVVQAVSGKDVSLVTGFLNPGETDEWKFEEMDGSSVTPEVLQSMLDLGYG